MKTTKIFTLDVELAEKLQQESNASALVNRLLNEYYSMFSGKKKSDSSEGKPPENPPETN